MPQKNTIKIKKLYTLAAILIHLELVIAAPPLLYSCIVRTISTGNHSVPIDWEHGIRRVEKERAVRKKTVFTPFVTSLKKKVCDTMVWTST